MLYVFGELCQDTKWLDVVDSNFLSFPNKDLYLVGEDFHLGNLLIKAEFFFKYKSSKPLSQSSHSTNDVVKEPYNIIEICVFKW